MRHSAVLALFSFAAAFGQNTLFVSGVRVMPGETAEAVVVLAPRDRPISALQFDLDHPAVLTVAGRPLAPGKDVAFRQLEQGRTRFVIWSENRTAIEAGELLTLEWSAAADAPEEVHRIGVSHVIASDPDGYGVAVLPADSSAGVGRDPAPLIHPGGVVSAGGFRRGTVPGSLISIFGERLSGATQVTINGVALSLSFVSPSQINAVVPWELTPGPGELVVTAEGVASPPAVSPVDGPQPGFFAGEGNHALALNASGELNSPATPARPGETITIFLTGGGPVRAEEPHAVDGEFACTIGDEETEVLFFGLATEWPGIYRLQVVVPELPGELHAVSLTLNGARSNEPLLAVSPQP
ncbi:MAG: hypothetical protein IPM24_04885 [Bryobacterales bacterium]|nr:hypothetical protein [Bryobacterales bacterium]